MMHARELLEQVKQRIMADPDQYSQNSFCGSRCCIAGHIDVILNGADVHNARRHNDGFSKAVEDIERIARAALSEDVEPWLFGQPGNYNAYEDEPEEDAGLWPVDLSVDYENASDAVERAKVGCKAIDQYMEERGI